MTDQSWVWLIDLERTCGLLVGQCLQNMLTGERQITEEIYCNNWLQNIIFSSGLQEHHNEMVEVRSIYGLSYFVTANLQSQIFIYLETIPQEYQIYCKLALNLPRQYDEACAVDEEEISDPYKDFYSYVQEQGDIDSWELTDKDKYLVESVVRCFLVTLLKHIGLLHKPSNTVLIKEVHKCALNLCNKLLNSVAYTAYNEEEKYHNKSTGEVTYHEDSSLKGNHETQRFTKFCQDVLQRSLFIMLFMQGEF